MVEIARRFWTPLLLALAVIVPYAIYGDSTGKIREKLQSFLRGSGEEVAPIEGISDPDVSRLLALQQQYAPAGEPIVASTRATPTVSLEAALRFDVSPRWVLDSWPHVSTTRTDAMDGLRVPLVTGTGPADVVGSLTYYFDQYQQVQRISLEGVVGDERQVVRLVTSGFQLQREPSAGMGIFLAKWNGKPTSVLLIRRMPVVSAESPLQKFSFTLELNRPRNYGSLSPQLQNELQRTHASNGELNSLF